MLSLCYLFRTNACIVSITIWAFINLGNLNTGLQVYWNKSTSLRSILCQTLIIAPRIFLEMADANDASLCFYSDSCRLHLSILMPPYGFFSNNNGSIYWTALGKRLFNQNEHLIWLFKQCGIYIS